MRPGDLVAGRYRIERRLGGGGMAVVLAATDEELGRTVAVKVLADNLAQHDEIRRRFLREARIAGSLRHPNLIEVYDAGEDARPYIVMEHVDGPSLADVIRRRGPLSPDEAGRLAVQAADGLAHAHAHGIVHRDVKPANLLLGPDGTLKIADFGIAHAVEGTRLTATGAVLGTAAYLAPEQASGGTVGPATDVYALGVVLYELLTGRTPHDSPTLAELVTRKLAEPVPPPSEVNPSIPEALDVLVERSLSPDPGLRPTAGEVGSVLRGDSETLTRVLTRRPGRAPARRTHGRRVPLALAAAVLALAAAAAAVAVSTSSGDGASRPAPAPRVDPIRGGRTPAEQARNLSAWLRRYARGG